VVFFELHQLVSLTWNIVTGVQPTLHPNELYERLHTVKTTWMQLRAHYDASNEGDPEMGEGLSTNGVMDETELLERLMSHVKELMAITSA
jgi:hypothetical protein